MRISVEAKTKDLTRHLTRIQRKQIPFAAQQALNSVAFDCQNSIRRALPKRLDRPTGNAVTGKGGFISSVQVQQTNKKDLTARVGFAGRNFRKTKWKETPAKIMALLMGGGTRKASGKAIPVPIPKNIKLNQYGNLPRTKTRTLLAKPQYFSGKPRGRGAGVYERVKPKKNTPGKLKMLVSWKKTTQYRGGRFPLRRIVEAAVKKNYSRRFRTALTLALASAN